MKFEIITDFEKWAEIYNSTPFFHGKVYYSPQYCKAIENNGEGKACLCYYELDTSEGQFKILYPFIKKEIPTSLRKIVSNAPLFDIESPYGYGGPIILAEDGYVYNEERDPSNELAHYFTKEFLKWANESNIIAEFVRFNPMTMNHNLFVSQYDIELNRRTVSINTNQNFNSMLSNGTSARKRNYYKAQNNGLEVIWCSLKDEGAIKCFRELYDATMNRLDADKYYHFSDEYFKTLSELPDQNALISMAVYGGDLPVAASLFLFDEFSAHYHLGGSDEAYKDLQGSAFLLWEAAKAAHEMGCECLHLGGGLSLDPDDKLFAFKKGFSSKINEFYIGKRIIDFSKYYAISDAWKEKTGKTSGILLHYHNL